MNKVQVLRRYAPEVGIWSRQVAGWARAVRRYDLDTEISQTCGSKRHRKAGYELEWECGDRLRAASTPEPTKRRDENETLSGSRFASHAVCSMHSVGERRARDPAMADRGVGQVRGTVAQRGPDRGGSHGYDGALLRCGGGTSGAGSSGKSASVQGDQRECEEDGPQGCGGAGAVSGEGFVAGGKNEAEAESGVDASGRDTRPAGKTTLGLEGQDQQLAGDAGDRAEAGSLVEQDCAGTGAGTASQRDGAVGVADSGGADPGTVREHRGVGRAFGRRRPTTARIREPDQHQGHRFAECNGSTDGDWQDQRLRG